MSSELLPAQVLRVAGALEAAGIPYAVGGAIAYGYAAEPRGTTDIDINIFLDETDADLVLVALKQIGIEAAPAQRAELKRAGQVRLVLDGTFVDLFFPVHDFHASCARRAHRVAFDGGAIVVLSAEDLVVFKTLFNRPRDWIDIEQVLLTQGTRFDVDYTLNWLDEMLGPEDSTRVKLAGLVHTARQAMPGPD